MAFRGVGGNLNGDMSDAWHWSGFLAGLWLQGPAWIDLSDISNNSNHQ